jgi:hypothetical protein
VWKHTSNEVLQAESKWKRDLHVRVGLQVIIHNSLVKVSTVSGLHTTGYSFILSFGTFYFLFLYYYSSFI